MKKGPTIIKSCGTCNKDFTVPIFRDKRNGTRVSFCSNKCRLTSLCLSNKQRSGENSPSWKGDEIGYNGLHARIVSALGKPKECEFCGKKNDKPKAVDWANKSGEYKKSISDFFALCKSCHKRYDLFLLGNKVYRPELSFIDPRAEIGRHGKYHAFISIGDRVVIGNTSISNIYIIWIYIQIFTTVGNYIRASHPKKI